MQKEPGRQKKLQAQEESEAIKMVNATAELYFIGNEQGLRKMESVEKAMSENTKFVVPIGSDLVNVISEMEGILPLKNIA